MNLRFFGKIGIKSFLDLKLMWRRIRSHDPVADTIIY